MAFWKVVIGRRGRALPVVLLLALTVGRSRAGDLLAIGYGEALAGAHGVAVPVTARHDLSMHGFSLALSYPRMALRLLEISPVGTATAEVGTDFFQQEIDHASGTAVLGAIFSFSEPYQPAELPPTAGEDRPQLLAWLIFDVAPGAPGGEHAIRLAEGIGDPPISNRYTHRGSTVHFALEDGAFLVQSENVLTLESKFAFPGARIGSLYAFARHPKPLQGFQLAVSFDPRALTLTEATVSGTVLVSALGGIGKIEFLAVRSGPEEILVSPTEARTTAGVIFDFKEPFSATQVLPPETGSTTRQSIFKYGFQVQDGADALGEYTPLLLSESPAPDAINNSFIIDSSSALPRKVDGRIYFSTGFLSGRVMDYTTGKPIAGALLTAEPGGFTTSSRSDGSFTLGGQDGLPPGPYSVAVSSAGFFPARLKGEAPGKGEGADLGTAALFPRPASAGGFRRGLINGDGELDISDGIALLDFLFLGGPPPTCLDAADTNDDGALDLSDPVALFAHLFMGGDPPERPFATCGVDLNADELECLAFPLCR